MHDKTINQITYVDDAGVAWIAAVGASIYREDMQGASNKSVTEIVAAGDDRYDILIFGGDKLQVSADEDTVVYSHS